MELAYNVREEFFGFDTEEFCKTPYAIYIGLNKAKEFFKDKIEKLDTEGSYSKIRIVEEVPYEDIEKELRKYSKEKEKLELLMDEWKEKHPEYYRKQPSLPSSSVFNGIYDSIEFKSLKGRMVTSSGDVIEQGFIEDMKIEDAIQGYKAANEALKEFDNSSLDKYCIDEKIMVKSEFRQLESEERERLRKELNIPSRDELKESLEKKEVVKRRMSLNRHKSESDKILNEYMDKAKSHAFIYFL